MNPDPYSSDRRFDGWRGGSQSIVPEGEAPEVASAGFWILNVGWQRRGLIGLSEVPGGGR